MTRPRLPLVIAAGVAVLTIGGFHVFQQFLAGDSVPALSFPLTTASASGTTEPSVGSGATTALGDATPAGIAGTWAVGDGSLVGYRVREQLGGVTALTDAGDVPAR